MQTPYIAQDRSAHSIQITLGRPMLMSVIGLVLLAILSVVVWVRQSQANQRTALARVQAISEFENLASQARVHEDLARTYGRELSTRHQQSLAALKSTQIDPQSATQLIAKIESELREAERIIARLGEIESTVRARENIPTTVPLLTATQLQTQASLNQSIDQQRDNLASLRSLSDAIAQRHTLLSKQEADAERLAQEKAAAEKLAAEKAAAEKAAAIAAAQARAEQAERVAKTNSTPARAIQTVSQTDQPWRPAPPTYGVSSPRVQSTVVVERVIAPPPVFYHDPFYSRRTRVIVYPHYRYYHRSYACAPYHPYLYHRRPRGGVSIGLSFPIH